MPAPVAALVALLAAAPVGAGAAHQPGPADCRRDPGRVAAMLPPGVDADRGACHLHEKGWCGLAPAGKARPPVAWRHLPEARDGGGGIGMRFPAPFSQAAAPVELSFEARHDAAAGGIELVDFRVRPDDRGRCRFSGRIGGVDLASPASDADNLDRMVLHGGQVSLKRGADFITRFMQGRFNVDVMAARADPGLAAAWCAGMVERFDTAGLSPGFDATAAAAFAGLLGACPDGGGELLLEVPAGSALPLDRLCRDLVFAEVSAARDIEAELARVRLALRWHPAE